MWQGPTNGSLLQVEWWEYPKVMGTLKPYLLQYNLFELTDVLMLRGVGDIETIIFLLLML